MVSDYHLEPNINAQVFTSFYEHQMYETGYSRLLVFDLPFLNVTVLDTGCCRDSTAI